MREKWWCDILSGRKKTGKAKLWRSICLVMKHYITLTGAQARCPPEGGIPRRCGTPNYLPNSLPISPYPIPWKPANEIMEWDYMLFFLAMTGSFFLTKFLTKILKHFGCWPILLMRFWRNRFLKGQTTSDETVLKIVITKQIRYFSTTLLYQFFSTRQYVTSSFFKHNFLNILAEFGWIWRQMGLKFFFITNQILLHNFALSDFIFNDF